MLHKAMQNKGARIAIAVFATLLYALGVNLFIVPVGLYSGGMVGLSQVIRTVLTERVALLKGLDVSVMEEIGRNLPITEGLERMMTILKGVGYKTAILSGGFTYFGNYLRQDARGRDRSVRLQRLTA